MHSSQVSVTDVSTRDQHPVHYDLSRDGWLLTAISRRAYGVESINSAEPLIICFEVPAGETISHLFYPRFDHPKTYTLHRRTWTAPQTKPPARTASLARWRRAARRLKIRQVMPMSRQIQGNGPTFTSAVKIQPTNHRGPEPRRASPIQILTAKAHLIRAHP